MSLRPSWLDSIDSVRLSTWIDRPGYLHVSIRYVDVMMLPIARVSDENYKRWETARIQTLLITRVKTIAKHPLFTLSHEKNNSTALQLVRHPADGQGYYCTQKVVFSMWSG